MNPIEDADIKSIWAEHFPKRLVDGRSKIVCARICLVLSHKAQHETAERWSKKLRLVLRKFGVPQKEFHRVKSECNFTEAADRTRAEIDHARGGAFTILFAQTAPDQ